MKWSWQQPDDTPLEIDHRHNTEFLLPTFQSDGFPRRVRGTQEMILEFRIMELYAGLSFVSNTITKTHAPDLFEACTQFLPKPRKGHG